MHNKKEKYYNEFHLQNKMIIKHDKNSRQNFTLLIVRWVSIQHVYSFIDR